MFIALGLVFSPFTPAMTIAMAITKAHCDMINIDTAPVKNDKIDKKICCIAANVALIEAEVIFSHNISHYKQTIVFSASSDLGSFQLDSFKRPPKSLS